MEQAADTAGHLILIQHPWQDIIVPAIHEAESDRGSLISSKVRAILKRLGIKGELEHDDEEDDGEPLNGRDSSSSLSSSFDAMDFERKADECRRLLNHLTDHAVPYLELCPPLKVRDEGFFAAGLRYLLPYQREDPQVALNLLNDIFHQYFAVPYHHAGHAALVLHTSVELLRMMGIWDGCMSNLEKKAMVVSAVGHDVGHPGKTSAFLTNMKHPLALLYNDKSVLENYHCASLLWLLQQRQSNVLDAANSSVKRELRKQIIMSVLWTDLMEHFVVLKSFKHTLCDKYGQLRGTSMMHPADLRHGIFAMTLKLADLAYMAMEPVQIALQWAMDYYQEVFIQGCEERDLRLPQSDPMDLRSFGATVWFERNAKFGTDLVMPIALMMAEVERRANVTPPPSQTSIESAVTGSSSPIITPIRMTGLSSLQSQITMLKQLGPVETLAELAEILAEFEADEVRKNLVFDQSPRPTWSKRESRKDATPAALKLTSEQRGLAVKWISKMAPASWIDKNAKVKKTNIYANVVCPLQRNCELLRRAKFLTRVTPPDDV